MIYDEYNKYIRDYMRRYRGRGLLVDLEEEAQKRGYTIKELTNKLLKVIVRDKLFKAILDE